MNLNHRQLHPLGFAYQEIFAPSPVSKGTFIKEVAPHFIYINSSHCPQTIGVFLLTPQQNSDYHADKACLVPPGCCAPPRWGGCSDGIDPAFPRVSCPPGRIAAVTERNIPC